MKINLGKLLSVLSKLVVAIPTIVEAVKPIVHEVKGSKAPAAVEPQPATRDNAGAPTLPSH